MFIDTHAHVDFDDYNDLDEMLERATESGIERIVIPAVEPQGFSRMIRLVEKYDILYGALGVHPSEALRFNESTINIIKELSSHPKIAAIGECGLDYYWDKSFIEEQKTAFIKQIELSNELSLPLIAHDREAHQATFELLERHKTENSKVIMHCFSGSAEFAKECTKKGYYIALGGVISFKNAKKMKEVAEITPLESLLLETDSPYLTPEPFRGKRNEPAYIKIIAQNIAEIKGLELSEVEKTTTENAFKVFSKIKRANND